MQTISANAATTPSVCAILPHAFATQPLENGYDMGTVRAFHAHKDTKNSRIFTRVLNWDPRTSRVK